MGCSILYNLASRGVKRTVLLEREVLGSGSTGRSQAICRMHYSNRVTAEMAWESLRLYKDFEEYVGGPSGFVTSGYMVVVAPEDRRAMEDNVSMQRGLGINTGIISAEDAGEIAPMLEVRDAGGLAYEPESGYADPYAVTTSYARRARELGAQLYMGSPATDVEVTAGKVSAVITDQERIETPIAVIATGPWSKDVFSRLELEVPLVTTRHQVICIRRPDDLIPSHPGVGDIAQRFSFRPDSDLLTLVGAGDTEADLDTYNQGVDMATVEDSFAKLAHRMPAMSKGLFLGGWSGLFTVTPDWHPILDRVEGIEGLYCSIGFSGHGFKLAPMVGIAMAELILDGFAKTVDIKPLRMARYEEGDLLRSRYSYDVLA